MSNNKLKSINIQDHNNSYAVFVTYEDGNKDITIKAHENITQEIIQGAINTFLDTLSNKEKDDNANIEARNNAIKNNANIIDMKKYKEKKSWFKFNR